MLLSPLYLIGCQTRMVITTLTTTLVTLFCLLYTSANRSKEDSAFSFNNELTWLTTHCGTSRGDVYLITLIVSWCVAWLSSTFRGACVHQGNNYTSPEERCVCVVVYTRWVPVMFEWDSGINVFVHHMIYNTLLARRLHSFVVQPSSKWVICACGLSEGLSMHEQTYPPLNFKARLKELNDPTPICSLTTVNGTGMWLQGMQMHSCIVKPHIMHS